MAKASIIHWTHQKDSKGRSPVKVAVQNGQERKYFAMRPEGHIENLYLSPSEFADAMRFRSDLGKALKTELRRAENAIPTPFSWVRFKATYLNAGKSFYGYFEEYLSTLEKERPGTHLAYKCALSKWKKVSDDFQPVDLLGQLHKLERACKTKTTAGMYLRATRAVYNLIRKDLPDYPAWSYRISSKVATHKAITLTADQLKQFIQLKRITPAQEEARRLFMISFYAGGMNMYDLLNMKWSDVKKDMLVFDRQKTRRSSSAPIQIPMTEKLNQYLGERNKSVYVIDDFDRSGSPIELRKRANWFLKRINKRIKTMCEANDIEPFTTYSARHSFASMLKAKGVDIHIIKELLGHRNIRTTEIYLRDLDNDTKREAIEAINLDV